MMSLRGHVVGAEQGDVLFSHYEDEGHLWRGEGRREARQAVRFPQPFADAPRVHLSIIMWDIAAGANSRADVQAHDLSAEGFAIVFRTWGDTRVARVRVSWLAIGRLRDEELWEVG